MTNVWKAAVIGLGNIGFLFNLDPKRKGIWSHVTAYMRCKRTDLAAAAEIDQDKIDVFQSTYPSIPVYKTVDELMRSSSPDIVSICTPAGNHFSVVDNILDYPVKAIFCEKPLAETVADASRVVEECGKRNILLAVNHTRRWESTYLYAKELIEQGRIGEIRALNLLYPAQVFNIGTHIFDLARMLTGKDITKVWAIPENTGDLDPKLSGLMLFSDGITCSVLATGKREDLIFEIDIIGSEGRLKVTENGEVIELYRFDESVRYSGYRELLRAEAGVVKKTDRFAAAIDDIVSVLDGRKKDVNCTGRDGLASLRIATSMNKSAKNYGKPITVDG